MQVLWLDRDAAGEDTAGVGRCGKRENGLHRVGDVVEYFHPAWVEYKYIEGVYLGGSYEG